MTIKDTPSGSVIAAEITGVDLRNEIDSATAGHLRNLFDKYSVLVFRDQNLSEKDLICFSTVFGSLEEHFLSEYQRPGYPAIYVVSNIIENDKPIGISDAGLEWHTDSSWAKEPSAATVLHAKEVPISNGVVLGDTLFASMAAAYDKLDEELKKRLLGITAKHEYEHRHEQRRQAAESSRKALTEEQKGRASGARHPVVRTHPTTGRRCIYVNRWFTTGIAEMSEAEGVDLLNKLYEHISKEEFIYRHHWRKGDVIIWDNCAVQHKAIRDYALPQRRLMWRTTIKGSAPS